MEIWREKVKEKCMESKKRVKRVESWTEGDRRGIGNWKGATTNRARGFVASSRESKSSEKLRRLRGYLQGYKIPTRTVILRLVALLSDARRKSTYISTSQK